MPKKVSAADVFNFWVAAGKPEEFDLAAVTAELAAGDDPAPKPAPKPAPEPQPAAAPPAAPANGISPEMSAQLATQQQQIDMLNQTLAAEREQRKTEHEAALDKALVSEADSYVLGLIREGRFAAAQAPELKASYIQMGRDDRNNPIKMPYQKPDGTAATGSRLDAMKALHARIQPTAFNRELVNSNGVPDLTTLMTGQTTGPKDSQEYQMAAEWGKRRNTRKTA